MHVRRPREVLRAERSKRWPFSGIAVAARDAHHGYGNRNIGSAIDRFWLDGPLEISAVEQAQLMARLAQRMLPFSERSMRITRSLIRQDDAPEYTMFAKTGWSMDRSPQVGWLVGWIESRDKIYPFALNVDIQTKEDAAKRKLLVQRSLQTLLFQTR